MSEPIFHHFTAETCNGSFSVIVESNRKDNGTWEDTVTASALGGLYCKGTRYAFYASWVKTHKGLVRHNVEFKKRDRDKQYVPPRDMMSRLEAKVTDLLASVLEERIKSLNDKVFDLDCKLNQSAV